MLESILRSIVLLSHHKIIPIVVQLMLLNNISNTSTVTGTVVTLNGFVFALLPFQLSN